MGARVIGVWAWALIVFAVLFVLFFFRALPLQLDPARASNTTEQFDTARSLDRLARVLDGTPHPADSDALDATRARLLSEIRSLGYTPEVHDETACLSSISGSLTRCARVQNITFMAGSGSGPVLLLTAHYDSVDASPGFGDDGIGLAVWLEVAHHLKQTPPTRPVLFLLTDGEEQALLGAQAFVDQKFYGHQVGRIINLEARGVRGPAMMFETGHPNAGVVGDWAKNGARPFSNSMMTAIYELLPNSTDLTVHLRAGLTGINIAISDGLDFYHTAHDDLARLNRASVQHMGDQALGATRSFLAADWSIDKNPNAEIAYSDILSRTFVALPQLIAQMLLGLCFGLSAMLFMRPAKDIDWKRPDFIALAVPPAVFVAAGLFAFASSFLIGLIRPEPAFWVATPQALNAVFFIGSLIASALAISFLARKSRREALYASGWFWFLVVGVGLTFAVPGFSMIYLIPGLVFVAMSALAWVLPRWSMIFHGIACVFLILMFFPLIQLVETTMGLGMAAVFGVLEGMVLAPVLGLIGPVTAGKIKVFGPLAATFVIAAIATILAPAFTAANPLALNVVAYYDMDAKKAELFAQAPPGALPKEIAGQLKEGDVAIPGVYTRRLASKPLTFSTRTTATITRTAAAPGDNGTTITTFQIAANGARQVRILIPAGVYPTSLSLNGANAKLFEGADGYFTLDCVGRACDGASFQLTTAPPKDAVPPAEPIAWTVLGFWSGLPAEAQPIAALRTDAALPIQLGDITITQTKLTF